MGKCFRCDKETKDHSKHNVYLCDECYLDDIDFCINPSCTNQGIRIKLICPECPKLRYPKGHNVEGYKCKSGNCK